MVSFQKDIGNGCKGSMPELFSTSLPAVAFASNSWRYFTFLKLISHLLSVYHPFNSTVASHCCAVQIGSRAHILSDSTFVLWNMNHAWYCTHWAYPHLRKMPCTSVRGRLRSSEVVKCILDAVEVLHSEALWSKYVSSKLGSLTFDCKVIPRIKSACTDIEPQSSLRHIRILPTSSRLPVWLVSRVSIHQLRRAFIYLHICW